MAQIIEDQPDYVKPVANAPASQSAVRYGLIYAAVYIVFTLIGYLIGDYDNLGTESSGQWLSYLNIIIGLVLVYLGIKTYRDRDNAGILSIGDGAKWSAIFSLVAALITGLFMYIFFEFIAPEVLVGINAMQVEVLEEQGLSDREIDQALEQMAFWTSGAAMAVASMMGVFIYNFIGGLLISLFLKRSPEVIV